MHPDINEGKRRIMHLMKQKPKTRSRAVSTVFLILGMVFFVIGLSTDQNAFTWLAIGFLIAFLLSGNRWLKRK